MAHWVCLNQPGILQMVPTQQLDLHHCRGTQRQTHAATRQQRTIETAHFLGKFKFLLFFFLILFTDYNRYHWLNTTNCHHTNQEQGIGQGKGQQWLETQHVSSPRYVLFFLNLTMLTNTHLDWIHDEWPPASPHIHTRMMNLNGGSRHI